jgi:hypothetical protein
MPESLTITEWARRQAPHLDIVSASVPEPMLLAHNLVAVFREPDPARELVRAWERIESADGAVGMVVLGRAPADPSELERPSGVDPEGVTADAAVKSMRGAIPGAVVGAIVVALVVLVLQGWSGVVVGAALGGAAFGAVAGGVMSFTQGVGWGEAYRHSFVDADATAVVFASIHSDDPARIDDALEAVADDRRADVHRVERDGRVVARGR